METSVLQSCITEAKLLVDAAYNQTQRRWAGAWALRGPGRAREGGRAPTKDISPITLPLGTMRTVSLVETLPPIHLCTLS